MCLKYFVEHKTCEHHEYLGSHHCSITPCDLDVQHFYYIDDSFPVPLPSSLQPNSRTDWSVFACNACATKHSGKLDLDKVPVQYYPPTDGIDFEETRATGCTLPIGTIGTQMEEADEDDCDYDYDYKSLSDADEDEWSATEVRYETTGLMDVSAKFLTLKHHEYFHQQLNSFSNYFVQQRQNLSFVPSGLTSETYAIGSYPHYRIPHIADLVSPSMLSLPVWHGGLPALAAVHPSVLPPQPNDYPPIPTLSTTRSGAMKLKTSAALQQHSATPPCPTSPFIVGSMTDSYLRIEAFKRRHERERERSRRGSPLLRDALPARSISLADLIKTKVQKGRLKDDACVTGAVHIDTWACLPFAGDDDTEGGAEEKIGNLGCGNTDGEVSYRLAGLM